MKKTFKLSRYTTKREMYDGRVVFYNYQTNALSVYDKDELPLLLANHSDFIEVNEVDISTHKAVLYSYFVPIDLDELRYQELYFRGIQLDDSVLNLTILTTLGCNFNCYYCYENKTGGYLSNSTRDNLINYVEKAMPGKKKLGVAWYGGEPLLYAKKIIELSAIFKGVARKYRVNYESKLISNCYLLDSDLQDELYCSGIRELQVSYDGSRSLHDRVRTHKGQPSFDVITDNIYQCLGKWKIIIRVNVSQSNMSDIPTLLRQLLDRGIHKGSTIYFAPIHSNGSSCRDASDVLINNLVFSEEFNIKSLDFKSLALQYGFKVRMPLAASNFCSAVATSGVVIEPNGHVSKCYLDVGDIRESYGALGKEGVSIVKSENLNKWNDYTPFLDKSCRECIAMPICYGGCPWEAMRHKPKTERCHPLKNNLNKYIDFILSAIEGGAQYNQEDSTLEMRIGDE